MIRIWRIVPFYTLLLGSIRALECPSYCQCYEDSDINSISCVNSSRRFIPNYFDFEVKLVNMSGNLIPRLYGDSFHNQRYRSLEILDLSRNIITTIENRAFSLLKDLLEIDLSRNQLRSINRKMFASNRFLNSVKLSGNPITEIKHHAFPLSIFLQRLDFQGCRIKKIDDRALLSSPVLKYLNLKDNDLRSLSLNVLHNSSQLVQLLLDGNPWRCNKDLWLLLKWIRDHEVGKDSLMCVYDETDDAILWDTMTVDNIDKFTSFDVSGMHGGRSPRSQSGEMSIRSKLANYPEHTPDSDERENENEFASLKDEILDKKNPNRPPLSAEIRRELARKYYERKNGRAVSSLSHQELGVTGLDKNVNPSEAAEPELFSHRELEATGFDRQVDPSEVAEPEIVDMNVLLSLICIEFALLVVLLYILYKLWKWNKQPYEQGANITWNNLDKNVKPYHDISPPGYKRYSLSDDNFSLNDNNKEESGKHNDAESGYLSYHRHNSTEGAEAETNINNNEFPLYKRYPAQDTSLPSQNFISHDKCRSSAKQDIGTSMVVPRSLESMIGGENIHAANVRRNSSFRSLGRRTKIPYDRSISVDSATNYYYTYNPRSINNF